MGMDVWGKVATAEIGKHFHNNVWRWHPLWSYCEHVAPRLAGKVRLGHSNDGDGLGSLDSKTLASILREQIESGECEAYDAEYSRQKNETPEEPCDLCDATGKRPDMEVADGCNKCHGKGWVKPFSTWYDFSPENVEEFAAFLEHCGGFEIY